MSADETLQRAKDVYERAVFAGETDRMAAAERDLDSLEAELALARGRLAHARFLGNRQEDPRERELFERAAQLYRELDNGPGEAESLFWLGTYHQVVRGDDDTAMSHLERAHELAGLAGDRLIQSYTSRHIGFAYLNAGDLEAAQDRLEESLRLRRELDAQPLVAAALLALAELAHQRGRRTDAKALLDEADATALASGANGIRRWVAAAREELDPAI